MNESAELAISNFLNVLIAFFEDVDGQRYSVLVNDEFESPLRGDQLLTESWGLYEQLTDDQRVELREQLTLSLAAQLKKYAVRTATLAVRTADARLPYFGALALTVDDHFVDERDISCVLCVLYDACQRLGADANGMLAKATQYSAGRRRENLEYYYRESPDYMKNLSSMGYIASGNSEDFCYRSSFV